MQTNTKQCATIVFRCEDSWRKVWPTFLHSVNQKPMYGACIKRLKNSKWALNEVLTVKNQKQKKIDVFELTIHQAVRG